MAFKFEDLKVWQRALDLSEKVHQLTVNFPKEELHILTSQFKRAADSVALNIAEGSTGQSNAEFRRFLGYSVRSGVEVVACLYIAKRRDLIDVRTFEIYYEEAETLIKMIQALKKSIK